MEFTNVVSSSKTPKTLENKSGTYEFMERIERGGTSQLKGNFLVENEKSTCGDSEQIYPSLLFSGIFGRFISQLIKFLENCNPAVGNRVPRSPTPDMNIQGQKETYTNHTPTQLCFESLLNTAGHKVS
ncbi:unnamed protein product [Onchocerca flexuosa]|uniref:Uncharacterized protein n=1 Tax=Onchocerca flexuosa TaxID=387005 RepID=A0A183H213_9BILA|nr:unnamed protein product [Onchocerca flexuosa]